MSANLPYLRIDCLHVDDEMWDMRAKAFTLRELMHEAIGARKVDDQNVGTDRKHTRRHHPVPSEASVGDVPVYFHLTQAGSFESARNLLDHGFFHMIVTDAVDAQAGQKIGSERFETYSGYKLIQDIPWPTTQRLLYTKDYDRVHGQHEIDFRAAELSAYITDHPGKEEAEKRFKVRIRRMFAAAMSHAAIGDGRFWFRIIDKGIDHVFAEIREKNEDGWVVLSQFPLKFFGENSVAPGPHVAHYVTFTWFLGYSRASLATNGHFLVPGTRAAQEGVTFSGRASWVGALCSAYKEIRKGRNQKLFQKGPKGEKQFDAQMGGQNGFWPGGPHFVSTHKNREKARRIPPMRLNVLGHLEPIHEPLLPVSNGLPIFTWEEIGPVYPFLPAPPRGPLFPDNMPRTFKEAYGRERGADRGGGDGAEGAAAGKAAPNEQQIYRQLKTRLDQRPGNSDWEFECLTTVGKQHGMDVDQVDAIRTKGESSHW